MDFKLKQLLNKTTELNSYDTSAILWTLNYAASSAAINALVRALPDLPPEGCGIEAAAQYNEDIRNVDTSRAIGYLALKLELDALAENHTDTALPELSNTAEFMQNRQPLRAHYINEYNTRKLKGQAPRVTLKQYVDAEFGQAARNHNNLRAKIGDAMKLADTLLDQCGDDITVSDEFIESLYERCIPKLQERWVKAEIYATNYKVSQAKRDESTAAQLLIESMLEFVGGDIPSVPTEDDESFVTSAHALDNADASVASVLAQAGNA